MLSRSRFLSLVATGCLCLSGANGVQAETRADKAADVETAEFFAAMDSGQIEVKYIPLDATKANVLVKNMTEEPLTLELPKAFAGVPVLAQGGMMGGMGGGGMGGGGMGGMGGGGMGGGGGQAGGGGMGGMGGGMGGGGMGGGGMGGGGMGGMMRVAPGKQHKLSVTTVCLEHGKPDPQPKMKYKIIPLSEWTKDAEVTVLCEALGYNQVKQNVAQAAAWHLTDDMTWQQLAAKNRMESKYTGNVKFFNIAELNVAAQVVNRVRAVAESRKAETTTDEYSDEVYGSDGKPTESPSRNRG